MIIGQAIYQLVVTLVLYFAGPEILGFDRNNADKMLELDTIIFNAFVWMQIFNEFNNRRLDNKFNIFEGLHRNQFFIFINCLMVGLQVAIIYVGSRAFSIKPGGLSGTQWAISIVVAVVCLPWAVVVRLFPDEWFAKIAKFVGAPVVVVYRACGKMGTRIANVFRKKKQSPEEDGNAQDDVEAAPAAANPASPEAPAPPAIVVCDTPQVQISEPEKTEK